MLPIMALVSTPAPHAANLGMLLMAFSSTVYNGQLILCDKMRLGGWSEMFMMGLSSALLAPCVVALLSMLRVTVPARNMCKWVMLSGSMGASSILTMIIAVRMRLTMGDFAALNSANVVFAALLGRVLLGEALRRVHFLAIAATLAGSLLISKPALLFGQASAQQAHWGAYMLALVSGFCDACVCICTRRISDTSLWWSFLSFNIFSAIVCVACTSITGGVSLTLFAAFPGEAAGWLAVQLVTQSVAIGGYLAAAQMCPAALSAIVDTGTRMVVGYAAQTLLFDVPLEPMSLCGASLMLSSVAVMALVQGRIPETPLPTPTDQPQPSPKLEVGTPVEGDTAINATNARDAAQSRTKSHDEESESLASYVATEFAGDEPRDILLRLRQPRSAAPETSATIIGASAAVSVVASA